MNNDDLSEFKKNSTVEFDNFMKKVKSEASIEDVSVAIAFCDAFYNEHKNEIDFIVDSALLFFNTDHLNSLDDLRMLFKNLLVTGAFIKFDKDSLNDLEQKGFK